MEGINGKRIAIMQPGYLPWLGFFELMHNCDLFVFLDDVQYTKKDWRNRNRIRIKEGWMWLSVPVLYKNKSGQLIKDVKINNQQRWKKKHLNAIRFNYHKTKYFKNYFSEISDLYENDWTYLCLLDTSFITYLKGKLNITTPGIFSSSLNIKNKKSKKILEICKLLEAGELYDSKAAANFLEVSLFQSEGIKVKFQDYSHPVYNQVFNPFIPYMSVIDLLFNCGPDSLNVILGRKLFTQVS